MLQSLVISEKKYFFVSWFWGEGVFMAFGNPFSGSGVYKR